MSASAIIRMRAFFGPVGGGDPDYSSPQSEQWTVTRLAQNSGRQPDQVELQRALSAQVVDRTALFSTRTVHVWAVDESFGYGNEGYFVEALYWGQVVRNSFSIAKDGDSETAVGFVHRHHFGEPLQGEEVYNPETTETLIVAGPLRFNPTIDGRTVGNMASRSEDHDPTGYPLWIDPESGRSDEALQLHEQTELLEWSLQDACHALQFIGNPNETFLTNRDLSGASDPEFNGAEKPVNVAIRRGARLDEALDALLTPYGVGWFVDYVGENIGTPASRTITPTLRYYRRGQGPQKSVSLQAIGSQHDWSADQLALGTITYDIANVANRVLAVGQAPERELSIELRPGWPESDDSLSAAELDRGDPNSDYADKPLVHRLWVANEDGSWTDFRTDITEHLDLDSVFGAGQWYPHRRKLYPPLTHRASAANEPQGIRGPIRVEFATTEEPEADDWIDITGLDGGDFAVLPNQIGVYFNAPQPPDDLVLLLQTEPNLRVRVTGTLVGDVAVTKEATVPDDAPGEDPVTLLLDLADRYFDRQRQTTGDLASGLTGALDQRDDGEALQELADRQRDQSYAASVNAQLTLAGLRTGYEIGDVLTGIPGRNISFDRTTGTGTPKYPQIIGRTFTQQGARITTGLSLKPYDAPTLRGR